MPAAPHTAAGITTANITLPFKIHTTADAMLEARLATLAQPVEVSRSKPSTAVKASIRKVPVPGPTSPS